MSAPRRRAVYACDWPDCDRTYDRPAKLAEHHTKHTNTKEFACEVEGCGKTFRRKAHLQRHTNLVHVENQHKPFKCNKEDCDKSFSLEHQLKRHLLVHEKAQREKPKKSVKPKVGPSKTFLCGEEGCQFSCSSKADLLKHMRTEHTSNDSDSSETKAFKCVEPGCSKGFTRKFAMETHRKIVHLDERRFECQICQSAFGYKQLLTRHMQRVHCEDKEDSSEEETVAPSSILLELSGLAYEAEKELGCPQCRARFSRQYDLDRHLKVCPASN